MLRLFDALGKRLIRKNKKEEKAEALDSWMGFTEDELEFAEAIHEILENSSTKEEFLRLAKAKLREYKNPWIEDTLQSILNLDLAI